MPDIVTSQVFSDGEKGITATKMNNIIANSVIQPDFVTAKPSSATLDPTDQLLEVKGAGTYARITGQQLIDSVSTSALRRVFNAVGNPTFEVDQRNAGNAVAGIFGAGYFVLDRWMTGTSAGATMRFTGQQQSGNIAIPGTNFFITSKFYRLTLTTAQATLAAGDWAQIWQPVEGPRLRELLGDVHSVSILARSSVANLKFGLSLADNNGTHVLAHLCTLGAANTWTLVTCPNLPLWTAAGNFPVTPGTLGYVIGISLAAGTSQTVSANDTWLASSIQGGAIGQSNFAASGVSSTFDLAYIGHESGALCTTPIDCPFPDNLLASQRYYQKSYDYASAIGGITANGEIGMIAAGGTTAVVGPMRFNQRMAKVPTVTIYNPATGAANSIRQLGGANFTVTGASDVGETGFDSVIGATGLTANSWCWMHYTADTGW